MKDMEKASDVTTKSLLTGEEKDTYLETAWRNEKGFLPL
jgi:hypothetical protein